MICFIATYPISNLIESNKYYDNLFYSITGDKIYYNISYHILLNHTLAF